MISRRHLFDPVNPERHVSHFISIPLLVVCLAAINQYGRRYRRCTHCVLCRRISSSCPRLPACLLVGLLLRITSGPISVRHAASSLRNCEVTMHCARLACCALPRPQQELRDEKDDRAE